MPYAAEPQEIIINTTSLRAHYLRSKPLHPSQTELATTNGWVSFRYLLIVNFEWEQLLLSFAEEVKVEQPLELANRVANRLRAAAAAYQTY